MIVISEWRIKQPALGLVAGCWLDPAIPPLWLTLFLLKVADCICLMALDKPQAVPVDVHMWQIAQRDYSWHPTTSQAKGPSPQANKELGKESGMLELVMG